VARHAIVKDKAGGRDQVASGRRAPAGQSLAVPPPRRQEPPAPRAVTSGPRGVAALTTWRPLARLRPGALGGPGEAGRLFAGHWGAIFGGSMVLFLVRFLVPSPVGMADDGDGTRLMCGLGVAPVTGGNERYDGYAYFRYALSPGNCAHAGVYSSSQHVLLVAARWLTPVLGLKGAVNLVALGVVTCAVASVGIASLACGLAPAIRSRLAVAAALWLVMADGVFFDTFASPYSEGATLTGLLLVTAGLVYVGRGGLASAAGIALAGAGGYLAVLSKEEYVPLIVPVAAGLLLAALVRHRQRQRGEPRGGRRRLTGQLAAAGLVAALLGAGAVAYAHQDASGPYTRLLHQEQVVDVIFSDIVPKRIAVTDARARLAALGLPRSWVQYAGHNFWSKPSVYNSPLYGAYADRLTDTNLARYLVTHPVMTVRIAQASAVAAMNLRVDYLGNYAPSAGAAPGTLDNRVGIVSSIVGVIPTQLGLFWLIPLWAVMLALSVVTLRRPQTASWHHDAAVATIALTGCAVAAFVPAAFFDGIEITRHMLGMNMATALAFTVSFTLLASLLRRGLRQESLAGGPGADRSWEGLAPPPRVPAG
jgi:hypothetical protein